jgi:hypothetical protein
VQEDTVRYFAGLTALDEELGMERPVGSGLPGLSGTWVAKDGKWVAALEGDGIEALLATGATEISIEEYSVLSGE